MLFRLKQIDQQLLLLSTPFCFKTITESEIICGLIHILLTNSARNGKFHEAER